MEHGELEKFYTIKKKTEISIRKSYKQKELSKGWHWQSNRKIAIITLTDL